MKYCQSNINSTCPVTQALRRFEDKHRVWMNTSVYSEAGKVAKREKDEAMRAYDEALRNQPLTRQNLHGVML